MTINVTEIIRKTMGWCPNSAILNKKEEMYIDYFFNFVKSANVHRVLAGVNLASFGLVTLSLFTLIVAIPNVLTFFSKPSGEPDEKVADVSRFFATDSEDDAKGIAEKYGADTVYISRQRMNDLIGVMMFAADIKIYAAPGDVIIYKLK